MSRFWPLAFFLCAGVLAMAPVETPRAAEGPVLPAHGIAMHGDLKYPPGFKHFNYVNPNAPKGGTLKLSALRTFDTLNPYTLKGLEGAGAGRPFETLLVSSADEPFSEYGLLAESVETPDDRSWVVFNLRPQARFHDGKPVTAEDVVWTFNTLLTKGHPIYRLYYGGVEKVAAEGPHRVRFTFKPGINRELPLILGQLPVLAKHDWDGKDFEKTTMTAPLGSGPYRVAEVEPGRSITYERVKNYWGHNLPVNIGRHNFDRIRYDYYRDGTIALEALKSGNYDFREENVSKFWAASYDTPAVSDGFLKKIFLPHQQSTGMQAFVFNTRKPIFADRRVREALAYAFDFEWTNRVLFFGQYARTESYFSNSELAATGLPQGQELAILERFRAQLPVEVFTRPYTVPSTGSKHAGLRANLLKAINILAEAGWVVKNGVLVNAKTGTPMTFDILLRNSSLERIVLPMLGNLKRLGIIARVRTVDSSQYENRRKKFDYDMVSHVWGQSLSPGNEQRDYWASTSADVVGSYNIPGVRDPVVDQLISGIVAAKDRPTLIAYVRALDRVLLWGHYVIPHWHIKGDRLAFWNKFGRPAITPARGYQLDAWWIDPKMEKDLEAGITEVMAKGTSVANPKKDEKSKSAPWGWIAGGMAALLALVWLARRRRQSKDKGAT
ncbi:MAG: microcin C transport system substrate-binding protein [Alphaproteobacteria bacterium]|jgi:microcin C transport system substrate-binding protein